MEKNFMLIIDFGKHRKNLKNLKKTLNKRYIYSTVIVNHLTIDNII